MRLWPRSLARRLALLLVLTLVAAQALTFALFARERVEALRETYREDLFARFVSLVRLIEDAPPDLHERLAATASSSFLRVGFAAEPAVTENAGRPSGWIAAQLASALGRPSGSVRVAFAPEPGWRRARRNEEGRRGRPRWLTVSLRLASGRWLNAATDRPPVPPLGGPFLVSLLLSAASVGLVGALSMRRVTRPMRRLAEAADRLGRGEAVEPLPEDGAEETRRTNVAFNRMRERLDRFVRDRTAMLAAIAHDLRTPITTLRLRAEFIDDDETRTKILETLDEMQAMAEASLAFAKGDAAGEATRAVDLAALVESLVEDAAETGADVAFEPATGPVLSCRPLGVRRAVRNLLDNAVAYGERARVRLEQGADEARIVIDDDGPGVPAADLERVFEPFVRLEGSRSRDTGGVGLGLAIARSLVRGHGGEITLENRQEGGLRAVISLPLALAGGGRRA